VEIKQFQGDCPSCTSKHLQLYPNVTSNSVHSKKIFNALNMFHFLTPDGNHLFADCNVHEHKMKDGKVQDQMNKRTTSESVVGVNSSSKSSIAFVASSAPRVLLCQAHQKLLPSI